MSDFVYQGDDFDAKVRQQVEFYFSDSNLQTDKFLWKIYEANDGWVELKTIMTFGRMRQYRPEEKVVEALKKSDKLILSPNGESIRRKDPLKDFNELKTIRKRNTVHMEGFPSELSQEDVETWFHEKIAPVLPKEKEFNSIRRIRTRSDKKFFGVVDVEFKTHEDAEYMLKQIEVCYPEGIVEDVEKEGFDKKTLLKKMSLLTFQEMRETGKRFGVNEVGKRRNSFDKRKGKNKLRKQDKGDEESKENESKESESKESESKESESKESESKESESKETESKETESKETESKETESKESESKENELKETESKENESKENEEAVKST